MNKAKMRRETRDMQKATRRNHTITKRKPSPAPGAAMTYSEAIRALNNAAYAAIRAGNDTTALPEIDRHSLRLIASETDRLVDYETTSGLHPSRIEAASSPDMASRISELEAERDRLREVISSAFDDMRWNDDESAFATLKTARAALGDSEGKAAEKQEFLNDLTAFSQEVDP